MQDFPLTIADWKAAYKVDPLSLRPALSAVLERLDPSDPAWISIITPSALESQIASLEARLAGANGSFATLPLFGVPFAIKDNIDAAGMATTAACPAFSYIAEEDSHVVARLKAAGAIAMGKTNLDQFATGLVGTRSPYGAVPNTFSPTHVSGGSSSGSASVVARGLVAFSLGTDTAGSGRVPAAFNNLIGLKPTRGAWSARGVVPACRSLDCVTVFALTLDDAEAVHAIADGFDAADAYSRRTPSSAPGICMAAKPTFAVPAEPKWFGDTQGAAAFEQTLEKLRALGVTIKPVDFTPMHAMASLLYGGPWVAERMTVVEEFMKTHADDMNPVVRGIIAQATNFTAADSYRGEYQRMALMRAIRDIVESVDALLVPSAPTFPTTAEVSANPVEANSRLGTYTNFVNLSDCCALALPAGFREDGLPFGITLIAPAWHDAALSTFGKTWLNSLQLPLGATGRAYPPASPAPVTPPPNTIRVAVVGAHLSGMPLNPQLTERSSTFVETTTTSSAYRLYALPGTVPPKPGLIKTGEGAPIEVELWDMPLEHFGSFMTLIGSPLGIGTLDLADGRQVKGFVCESHVATTARDITHLGGWRAFMAAEKAKPA